MTNHIVNFVASIVMPQFGKEGSGLLVTKTKNKLILQDDAMRSDWLIDWATR